MFEVGQVAVFRSSGLRRRVTGINADGTIATSAGGHVRHMKVANLCTEAEYAEIHARYVARMNKKFGRR